MALKHIESDVINIYYKVFLERVFMFSFIKKFYLTAIEERLWFNVRSMIFKKESSLTCSFMCIAKMQSFGLVNIVGWD